MLKQIPYLIALIGLSLSIGCKKDDQTIYNLHGQWTLQSEKQDGIAYKNNTLNQTIVELDKCQKKELACSGRYIYQTGEAFEFTYDLSNKGKDFKFNLEFPGPFAKRITIIDDYKVIDIQKNTFTIEKEISNSIMVERTFKRVE